MTKSHALALWLTLLSTGSAWGQSSYPMLMDTSPLAAQVGSTSEHEVHARYSLDGAYQVFVSGTGVRGEVVPPAKPSEAKDAKAEVKADAKDKKAEAKDKEKAKEKAKDKAPGKDAAKEPAAKAADAMPAKKPELLKLAVRFTVAADALPGVRDFRLVTPQGVTTLGQMVVVRDPVTCEKAPNDTLATALAVTLPAAVCGAIEKAEDVDFYKFHVDTGQALSFHVVSSRCENKIHDLQAHSDPILTLRNSTGTVLAISDNYFFADPLLHHRFAQAGDYYLEMRDVRYQGNAYWQYCVEINDRPLVTQVFPLGVTPERPTKLELVGVNLPRQPTATITLPGSATGPVWVDLGLKPAANPVFCVANRLPEVLQVPGNHEAAKAQTIAIPAGVNGRISAPGQLDYYSFQAKKGEQFSFEVIARRQLSALDPVLTILNEKGSRLLENDDMAIGRMNSADSQIENWAAPADGRYVLELRDLHLQGGPQFVYYLEATRSEPYFRLEVDSDKSLVAPGGFAAIFVRVYRKNGFTGEVALAVDGLPRGVTATCGRILDGATDGAIVLVADPKAAPSAANVSITGTARFTADGRTWNLSAQAFPNQETYMPGGGRGLYPVHWHTVSVNEPLDIPVVKVSPTRIELKPGGSQKIDITLSRAPDFDKNVTLDLMSRHLGTVYGNSLPAGVTIDDKKSKTLLNGQQNEGFIVLVAAADAKPVEKQIVPVMANVAINFVMKMSYTGPPLEISVTGQPEAAKKK